MDKMTSIERIDNILRRKPVDRVGLNESFWGETVSRWRKEGHLVESEAPENHFGYDYRQGGWPNCSADPEYKNQVLEETEEWQVVHNANGAHLKWWKHKAGTPEHVFFEVQDSSGWEEHIRPKLLDDKLLRKRINVEGYRVIGTCSQGSPTPRAYGEISNCCIGHIRRTAVSGFLLRSDGNVTVGSNIVFSRLFSHGAGNSPRPRRGWPAFAQRHLH